MTNTGNDKVRCEEARVLVSRDLDGELARDARTRLEHHLAACAPCRAERAALSGADALLSDAFAGHPFDEKLVADIVRMAAARTPSEVAVPVARPAAIIKFRGSAGLVAAAAAAALLVVTLVGTREPVKQGPNPVARAPIAKAYGAGVRVQSTVPGNATVIERYQVVREGDQVINAGGTLATLVLQDETKVYLRPDTAVVLRAERDGGTTVALSPTGGEVYCEVAKQRRPFRVATTQVTATVLGTRFLVRATNQSTSVAVVEGRVQVSSASESIVVSEEKEAVVAFGTARIMARPLTDARQQLAWNSVALSKLPATTLPSAPARPASSSTATPLAPGPRPDIEQGLDQPVK